MEDIVMLIETISKMRSEQLLEYFANRNVFKNKNSWIAFWIVIHEQDPDAGSLDLLTMHNSIVTMLEGKTKFAISQQQRELIEDLVGVTNRQHLFNCLNLLSTEQLQIKLSKLGLF